MSITTLIIGESGTGKTSALRNFDCSKIFLIQTVKKPLPFKSTGLVPKQNFFTTDRHDKIISGLQYAIDNNYKVIVIDDFQYLMANEFMARAYEPGFNKFTEIARHAWEVINKATSLPDDVRVYILSHITTGDDGTARLKTIGKLLDEKITVEGMVTIVLRTAVMDGEYIFRTKNSGTDTVKTPMGMFESETVDNDLKAVDEIITTYYDINKGESE